jgi:hypothetical protein
MMNRVPLEIQGGGYRLTCSGLVLTNLGEKMTDEEVDELLKAVDTSSGEINYTGMFLFLLL